MQKNKMILIGATILMLSFLTVYMQTNFDIYRHYKNGHTIIAVTSSCDGEECDHSSRFLAVYSSPLEEK